jgi:cell division septation protein DedD
VLVGRGVRAERRAAEAAALSNAEPVLRPAPAPQVTPLSAESDPTAAAPPPATPEDLKYFERLEREQQLSEKLKPPAGNAPAAGAPERVATAAAIPKAAPVAPPSPVPDTPKPAAAKPAPPAPPPDSPSSNPGPGYAVQVAALNSRGEAEAMVKRLTSKGYAAFVLAPGGTPTVFRVRIGPFETRREADAMAARLEKEEQFKPWVAR